MNEVMNETTPRTDGTTVAKVCEWMEEHYPAKWAEDWDKVGLIAGDRTWQVQTIYLALDPVQAVIQDAVRQRADLVITHHPLYLRGTSFVSADDPKGRSITALLQNRCALFNAHTNADNATPGVATILAKCAGLTKTRPLQPFADNPQAGELRLGELPKPLSLGEFAEQVARNLPADKTGLLVGGDLAKKISTVAVCGGAGDSYIETCRQTGVDAYLTADLRHHPAQDCLEHNDMALLSGSHWATESIWISHLGQELQEWSTQNNLNLKIVVSQIRTEPWSKRFATGEASPAVNK